MDRFAKNFIIASIIYFGAAALLGVAMLWRHDLLALRFVHSHLNMLGWVSMMIYGVGYHILPRFMGKPLKYPKMGDAHFWLANIGLVGMLLFYAVNMYQPSSLSGALTVFFGAVNALSVGLFFYNILASMLVQPQQP